MLFIGLFANNLCAQNKVDEFNEEQAAHPLIDWRLRDDMTPSVLNATSNVLHTMVQYYGRHIGWNRRSWNRRNWNHRSTRDHRSAWRHRIS